MEAIKNRLLKFVRNDLAIETPARDALVAEIKAAFEPQKFTLFWKDGQRHVLTGHSIEDALGNAGYGGGAMAALDFWSTGDDSGYRWDKILRRWQKIEVANVAR